MQSYIDIRLFFLEIWLGMWVGQIDPPEKTTIKMSSLIRVNIVEAEKDQINVLNNKLEFNERSRKRLKEEKDKKEMLMKMYMFFMKVKN